MDHPVAATYPLPKFRVPAANTIHNTKEPGRVYVLAIPLAIYREDHVRRVRTKCIHALDMSPEVGRDNVSVHVAGVVGQDYH
jgi:hypothetical protein